MSRSDVVHYLTGLAIGLVLLAVFAAGLLARPKRRASVGGRRHG
jgi:hypothetical protein